MKIVGLLLAGGRSRRLGQDKRFLKFKGKPLILRAYEVAAAVADEVWVLLADSQDEPKIREALGARPLRVVLDPEPGAGPLAALAGALGHIDCEYALLLAVDYPLITSDFLQRLRAHLDSREEQPDVLMPLWQGVPQVTCAFYRCSLHKELQKAFQGGGRSLRRWIESLDPRRVSWVEDHVWRSWTLHPEVFLSVNTPEDYERLCGPGP